MRNVFCIVSAIVRQVVYTHTNKQTYKKVLYIKDLRNKYQQMRRPKIETDHIAVNRDRVFAVDIKS